jgi:hypothetical protein
MRAEPAGFRQGISEERNGAGEQEPSPVTDAMTRFTLPKNSGERHRMRATKEAPVRQTSRKSEGDGNSGFTFLI